MEIEPKDIRALIEEKYGGNRTADIENDLRRLSEGEPLAYVIGHIPFLGLSIALDSHPLIPRPETEWWAEELIKHIGDTPTRVLDLCAGSGAIGLAVLKHCPNAHVSFGELSPVHVEQIRENFKRNTLDAGRAVIRAGDLFVPFGNEKFTIVATNPPYIPSTRELPKSVTEFEPSEALFGGTDGLDLIRRIVSEAPAYLLEKGELWMECDTSNVQAAHDLAAPLFAHVEIRNDPYGRERLIVAQL